MRLAGGYNPVFHGRKPRTLPQTIVRFGSDPNSWPDDVKAAHAMADELTRRGYGSSIFMVGQAAHGSIQDHQVVGLVILDAEAKVLQAADLLCREGLAERVETGKNEDSWNRYFELLRYDGQLVKLQHLPRPNH